MDDSRRPDPLNDPVEYLGVVARIEQNVCDVLAKSQPGIFRFFVSSRLVRLPNGASFARLHLAPGGWELLQFLKPE
jgi:hypothetical protein